MKRNLEYIESSIRILVQYHTYTRVNTNITLNIALDKTKITLIPKNVQPLMEAILDGSLGYGPNISLSQTKAFLKREY